jgi:hypothetical protein
MKDSESIIAEVSFEERDREKERECSLSLALSLFLSGATRNRTGDTRIFSPLLYRLSYGTCFSDCKYISLFRYGKTFLKKILLLFFYARELPSLHPCLCFSLRNKPFFDYINTLIFHRFT